MRALLRGLTAALRNLPTIVSLLAEEFKDAAMRFSNTQAIAIEKTLKGLISAENLQAKEPQVPSSSGVVLATQLRKQQI